MPPKVSVIIPVYNIEESVGTCLQSVTGQTFRDLEIIVVNDGSTDGSLEVIKRYAATDSRIVIVDKQNEGLAYARRSGLQVARGEYVQHLDGDDYLEPDAIEVLYSKAVEEDADMVSFPFYFDYPDRRRATKLATGVYDSVSFIYSTAFCRNYWAAWSHMHRRSLYDGVTFERINYGEDVYLTSQLACFARKIVVIDSHPLLHYVIRNDSISFGTFSDQKARNIETYPRLVRDFYKDKPTYPQIEKALANIELGAIALLLSKRRFGDAPRLAKRAMEIERQFPGLLRQRPARHWRSLLMAYAKGERWGRLMKMYYALTRKLK